MVTLHRALTVVGGIVAFILNREEQYPALHARSHGVAAFPEIVQRIDAIVDRFGNVKDNASPGLLRSGALSANARDRPPNACRPCCRPPRTPASSMPTPRFRSARAKP
ncbi:MAG: hypothetical protein ACLRM8_06925 [Alistipes sp.]